MVAQIGRTVRHPDGSSSIVLDLVIDTTRFTTGCDHLEAALARLEAARDRACRRWCLHHPLPLSIDGHAYRRRVAARRRRNR